MNAPQHQTDFLPRDALDVGVGERLRIARHAANLTLEEVAARLHLDAKTVRHIEADEYAALPAPAFVRGYLRSYARLLKLPPAPIVEAFDRNGFEPPALVADISNHGSEAHSGDFPVRLVTYFIVAVLATLMVAWWHNQRFNEIPSTSGITFDGVQAPTHVAVPAPETRQSASAPAAPGDTLPPAPGAATAAAAPVAGSAPGATIPPALAQSGGTDAAPVTAAPAAAGAPAPVAAAARTPAARAPGGARTAPALAAAVTSPAKASPETPGPAANSKAPAPQPPRGSPASAVAALAATPAGGKGVLEMAFDHESWVEVYNQKGDRLYYDLVAAGQHVKVSGKAPFRVLLGYAHGVRIEYNGKPFDQSPYTNREIARFTLGSTDTPQLGAVDPATVGSSGAPSSNP